MPFAKRVVEPQLLCRYQIPNEQGELFEDLVSISNVALSRTLRQLSDLAKHACSIFQELENELSSSSQRVMGLQSKINQLQQTCSELNPKQEAVRRLLKDTAADSVYEESDIDPLARLPLLLLPAVFVPSCGSSLVTLIYTSSASGGRRPASSVPAGWLLGSFVRVITSPLRDTKTGRTRPSELEVSRPPVFTLPSGQGHGSHAGIAPSSFFIQQPINNNAFLTAMQREACLPNDVMCSQSCHKYELCPVSSLKGTGQLLPRSPSVKSIRSTRAFVAQWQ
ncbi:hypothetical protein PAMP_024784 [Pampus punctatissimus]